MHNKIRAQLITEPDHPALFVPARKVETDDDWDEVIRWWPRIQKFVEKKKNNAAGLAANQLAIRLAFFVTAIPGMPTLLFVNPSITTSGALEPAEEGCLSNPDVFWKRERYEHVEIRAQNVRKQWFRLSTKHGILRRGYPKQAKFFAQVCQHEMEHLAGIDVRTGEEYDHYMW